MNRYFSKNITGTRLIDDMTATGSGVLPRRFEKFHRDNAVSLDGVARFCHVPPAEEIVIPAGFESPDFDDARWSDLPVPSCWQLHGYGSPKYINTRYTFEADALRLTPPVIPDARNSVGLYRIKKTYRPDPARRTILCAGGFSSALLAFVNGRAVGFAGNGRTAAEFDVSEYIVDGENLFAFAVPEFSAGSFLECQDMWRLSGIFRSLSLYQIAPVHLLDVFARAEFNEALTDARLTVTCKFLNMTCTAQAPRLARVALLDESGAEVTSGEGCTGNKSPFYDETLFHKGPQPVIPGAVSTAYASLSVSNPALWSAEEPTLYAVRVTACAEDGGEEETVCVPFGFRQVDIQGAVLRVNGAPVKLKGVCRHEFSPENGYVITEESMLEDIRLMKAYNVNAVRCAHYPHTPAFYDLCDRYGLYVCDEANLESHGISYRKNLLPGNDFRWQAAVFDRENAMVQTNKNHASIIMWSLGNEFGFGEMTAAASAYVRALDPSRLIHKRQMNSVADVDSENYQSVPQIKARAQARPDRVFISAEYAHAMGNACGNLSEYWALYNQTPNLGGGFIWEFFEHGLYRTLADGKRAFAYGGDFGEAFHDGNFCIDGLVTPDRRPTAKLATLKKAQSPAVIGFDAGTGVLCVTNGFYHTDLGKYKAECVLLADGRETSRFEAAIGDPAPGETARAKLLIPKDASGAERVLTVEIRTKQADGLLPAGHTVAAEQFVLAKKAGAVLPLDGWPTLFVTETDGTLRVQNEGMSLAVTRDGLVNARFASGGLYGLRFTAFRAPTDNDACSSYGYAQNNRRAAQNNWRACGLDRLKPRLIGVAREKLSDGAHKIVITSKYEGARDCGFDVRATLVALGCGRVFACFEVTPYGDLPALPRMGVTAACENGLDRLTYYGSGPFESYPDRDGGLIGVYSAPASEQMRYIKPQEYGAHARTRYLAMTDGRGAGVVVSSAIPRSMSMLPYSAEQLAFAAHDEELVSSGCHFTLDAAQNGVGNASCGPEPLPEYLLMPSPVTFTFSLSGVSGGPVPFADTLPEGVLPKDSAMGAASAAQGATGGSDRYLELG